ncbi:MAG TPA: hypothetical protein PKC60_14570 [Hydrogenophaga sp.]|uniref:hypothetical protein n=1 Tax=Hydrogenophaga sp. TaxID=1904254 RepID=UPI002BB65FF9|nr:hypothetical protein [Hydrogenophaga sp.]HMN94450.1 hypothetical protein [Hydrogenophaga sp.]HMP12050.1 hypothetical protein [Hydrogenophaga sp.]
MISAITRVLRLTFGSRHGVVRKPTLRDMATIRRALAGCFEDCLGEAAERLRRRVEQAQSPQELWLLRNDAFQIIAQRHDQGIASERINGLLPVFEEWLDRRHIGPV